MTDPRDDDALSWGDDDPTLDTGASPRRVDAESADTALPDGFRAVGKGSETVGPTTSDGTVAAEEDATESAPMSNAALVGIGILGGVYLLFTIGWFIGGSRLQTVAPLLLISDVAFVPFFWMSVLAPAIWFGTTLLLTRAVPTWLRFVWLAAGALLLVPWPFVMIGVVGQ